jgi:hypothetical protein
MVIETVHIMLVGENVDHVHTVVEDTCTDISGWEQGAKIKRIYLIHSPDAPHMDYKKRANKLKKEIEKNSTKKVHLHELPEGGAFDKFETIQAIAKIVKKERNQYGMPQNNIAVNITGGTNMMAVGAILAAASNKINAYYVKDNRWDENKNLPTNISQIAVPFQIKEDETAKKLQKILFAIKGETYSWNHTPEDRPYVPAKMSSKMVKTFDGQIMDKQTKEQAESYGLKIESSIKESEWMLPRTMDDAILQKDLFKKLSAIPPSTIRGQLKILKQKAMVTEKLGVPELTNAKRGSNAPTRYYRINQKEKILSLTDQGKAELQNYKP